jgi:hypothetical protein
MNISSKMPPPATTRQNYAALGRQIPDLPPEESSPEKLCGYERRIAQIWAILSTPPSDRIRMLEAEQHEATVPEILAGKTSTRDL